MISTIAYLSYRWTFGTVKGVMSVFLFLCAYARISFPDLADKTQSLFTEHFLISGLPVHFCPYLSFLYIIHSQVCFVTFLQWSCLIELIGRCLFMEMFSAQLWPQSISEALPKMNTSSLMWLIANRPSSSSNKPNCHRITASAGRRTAPCP